MVYWIVIKKSYFLLRESFLLEHPVFLLLKSFEKLKIVISSKIYTENSNLAFEASKDIDTQFKNINSQI